MKGQVYLVKETIGLHGRRPIPPQDRIIGIFATPEEAEDERKKRSNTTIEYQDGSKIGLTATGLVVIHVFRLGEVLYP